MFSPIASPTRSLTATQIHALASLPVAIRSTFRQLQTMGYTPKQAYALAVRARQS